MIQIEIVDRIVDRGFMGGTSHRGEPHYQCRQPAHTRRARPYPRPVPPMGWATVLGRRSYV